MLQIFDAIVAVLRAHEEPRFAPYQTQLEAFAVRVAHTSAGLSVNAPLFSFSTLNIASRQFTRFLIRDKNVCTQTTKSGAYRQLSGLPTSTVCTRQKNTGTFLKPLFFVDIPNLCSNLGLIA